MAILLPLLLVVLMVSVFASLMREGLWSNALTLVNVIVAALMATNFFEPLAAFLESKVASGTMFWDLLSLWAIFGAVFFFSKTITDAASRVSLRFKKPIDQAGGYFFAAWTAWVLVCFLCMTLHTAPLSRNFFFEGFTPERPIFFGIKPDRLWLAWVQKLSQGPYDRLQSPEDRQAQKFVFDPQGKFMRNYATRRAQYEKTDTFTGLPSQ